MNLSSNQKKILTNVSWALLGKLVNMLGNLFVGILVARYLGPEKYGIMNYVISFVTIFTVIAAFGLDNIEIRELSRKPEDKEIILGTSSLIRLAFAMLAYILLVTSLLILKLDTFSLIMILIYGLSLFSSGFNVFRNYFTSIIENKYVVKSEIYRTIVGAIIKIALLWFKMPLEYFIAATLFDTILLASGYFMSYTKKVGPIKNWKFNRALSYFLIKESFPLVLSGAAVIIYQKIDQVMIGEMIDQKSVGYFATAGRFVDVILFLPIILVQTITPILVKAKEINREEYEKKKAQFFGITIWSTILLSGFLSIFSYWVIRYTYGNDYIIAVPVLSIMAWKTVGAALSSTSGQIIIMEGLQKWAVIRNVLGCFLCVILNLVFIPAYGIIGSAWVTVITVLFSGFFCHLIIPPYRSIFKEQFISIICGWKQLIYIKRLLNRKSHVG